MAATHRINGAGAQVCVGADGAFGHAMAVRLVAVLEESGHRVMRVGTPLPTRLADLLWPQDAAVFAGGQGAEVDAFDAAAFAAGTPWIAIARERPRIRVGPLMFPPDGPCSVCHRTRQVQHGGPTEQGQTGDDLPPHLLVLASGLAVHLLQDVLQDVSSIRGRFFVVDERTDRVTTGRVVPVHGCRRCDQAAAPGVRRERRLIRLKAAIRTGQAREASR